MDRNGIEQIFTSCHENPEKRRIRQWKGFHLAPEEQLTFHPNLYQSEVSPGCGKYFIK